MEENLTPSDANHKDAEREPEQARPVFCSCGARLVADAVFCHRCGKPVFEPAPLETPPDPPQAAPEANIASGLPADSLSHPAAAAYLNPISLRNKLAVQIAFFIAVFEFPLITFSGLLPINPLIVSAVVLAFGGYVAVHLYQRRTHHTLGMLNGFRLGWISGLLLFVLVLVFGALQFAFFTFSGGSLVGQLDQIIAASGANGIPPEQQRLMREVFSDGAKLFVMVFLALLLLFLFLTACAGAGGALGARRGIVERRSG